MSVYQYTSKRTAENNGSGNPFHKPAKKMVKNVFVRSKKDGLPSIMSEGEALALKAKHPEIIIG